jgi:DNA-binding PadR family transcriptional regulator
MALRYALLGLLDDRPSSGYELTQRFAQGIGAYAWDAKHSQIYPELRKLLSEDLIAISDQGARGRKTYAITEAGRQELRRWLLAGPSSTGGVRNEYVLRLFLLSALEPDEAIRILQHTANFAERQIEELSAEYTDARARQDDITSYGALAAQYGVYAYRATVEWANWAIEEIRSRR